MGGIYAERVRLGLRLLGDAAAGVYRATVGWLDARAFPVVVSYATHPLVILATMLLLLPLIADASNTAIVLVLGNYTNVVSASVSSIVLMQSLRHHRAVKALHEQHAAEITALHATLDTLTRHVESVAGRQQGQAKPTTASTPEAQRMAAVVKAAGARTSAGVRGKNARP